MCCSAQTALAENKETTAIICNAVFKQCYKLVQQLMVCSIVFCCKPKTF